jgi:hypothetical protein
MIFVGFTFNLWRILTIRSGDRGMRRDKKNLPGKEVLNRILVENIPHLFKKVLVARSRVGLEIWRLL